MKKKNKKCNCNDCGCEQIIATEPNQNMCVCEVDMNRINFNAVVEDLYDGEKGVCTAMIPAIAENGFTAEDGYIAQVGEPKYAAFIPAKAMAEDTVNSDNAACVLVNTINDGFHYASVNDQNECIDMGKVVTPCIVGNVEKPSGVFIPFNNTQAIFNGYILMENLLENIISAQEQPAVICNDCAAKLSGFRDKF